MMETSRNLKVFCLALLVATSTMIIYISSWNQTPKHITTAEQRDGYNLFNSQVETSNHAHIESGCKAIKCEHWEKLGRITRRTVNDGRSNNMVPYSQQPAPDSSSTLTGNSNSKKDNTLKNGHTYSLQAAYHKKEYAILINPKPCSTNIVTVVIVQSLPHQPNVRESIRMSLGKQLPSINAQLLFLVGTSALAELSHLKEEHTNYGDVIMVDFIEDYLNLTLKSLLMLKWVHTYCLHTKYLVKIDDDVQLNVARLAGVLYAARSGQRQIIGATSVGVTPHRSTSSKYYVPFAVYKEPVYPTFVRGPCYVITTDLLSSLYSVSQQLAYFHLEDVFVTGLCSSKLENVLINHVEYFISPNCLKDIVAIHRWGSHEGCAELV